MLYTIKNTFVESLCLGTSRSKPRAKSAALATTRLDVTNIGYVSLEILMPSIFTVKVFKINGRCAQLRTFKDLKLPADAVVASFFARRLGISDAEFSHKAFFCVEQAGILNSMGTMRASHLHKKTLIVVFKCD